MNIESNKEKLWKYVSMLLGQIKTRKHVTKSRCGRFVEATDMRQWSRTSNFGGRFEGFGHFLCKISKRNLLPQLHTLCRNRKILKTRCIEGEILVAMGLESQPCYVSAENLLKMLISGLDSSGFQWLFGKILNTKVAPLYPSKVQKNNYSKRM